MRELESNGVEIYKFPVDDETVAEINSQMNVRYSNTKIGSIFEKGKYLSEVGAKIVCYIVDFWFDNFAQSQLKNSLFIEMESQLVKKNITIKYEVVI